MPQADEKYLVVSVHDVSPTTWKKVREILQALEQHGANRRTLLVVPNFQGTHPIDQAGQDFTDWLIEASRKDEVCLHGYRHQARVLPGGAVSRLIATIYTKKEGEFYTVNAMEAYTLLQQGMKSLAALDLKPVGFIAPAWLISGEALEEVHRLGFLYTTTLGRLILFRNSTVQSVRAPSLCYSVRSAWRRETSLVYNPFLFQLCSAGRIQRMAVHPVDLDYPRVFRQILRLVEKAACKRRILAYQDLVQLELHQAGEEH